MRNKQKAWRTQAAAVKQYMVKSGQHIRGARYGRVIAEAARHRVKIAGAPSLLMTALLVRHGSLQP